MEVKANLGETETPHPDKNTDDFGQLSESLGRFSRQLDRITTEYKTHLRATKGRFNLFTILRGSFDDEKRLHSRFLAQLLNPNGTHDYGDCFLQLFIETLKKRGVGLHSDPEGLREFINVDASEYANSKIEAEKRIDLTLFKEEFDHNGQIDILISTGRKAIAIENKTRPGEQKDQICRYVTWLKHKYEKPLLLYLTPMGNQSATAGKMQDNYRLISYHDHILPWIEDCLRATYEHVNINQALQQYKNVVNQLLLRDHPMEAEYMKDVIQALKKEPIIIRYENELIVAIKEIKDQLWGDFVDRLQKALGTIKLENETNKGEKFRWIALDDKIGLSMGDGRLNVLVEWNINTQLRIGLSCKDNKTGNVGKSVCEKHADKLAVLMKQLRERYRETYVGVGGGELNPYWFPSGAVILESSFMTNHWVAEHLDSRRMSEAVDKVASIITEYLAVVSGVWK